MHLPLIEKQSELAELCRRFDVVRLEVFGSAATDSFDPGQSDIDFLVEFSPNADLGPWMSRYFELQEALQSLFGRNVDLVMVGALRNPYFVLDVNRTRRVLYARQERETS